MWTLPRNKTIRLAKKTAVVFFAQKKKTPRRLQLTCIYQSSKTFAKTAFLYVGILPARGYSRITLDAYSLSFIYVYRSTALTSVSKLAQESGTRRLYTKDCSRDESYIHRLTTEVETTQLIPKVICREFLTRSQPKRMLCF